MTAAELDDLETRAAMRSLARPSLPITGLIVAAIPFFASFRVTETKSSTSMMPGGGIDISTSTVTSGIDYVAVAAGAVAILIALVAVAQGLRVRNYAVPGIALFALALGAYQILRGTIWIA